MKSHILFTHSGNQYGVALPQIDRWAETAQATVYRLNQFVDVSNTKIISTEPCEQFKLLTWEQLYIWIKQ